MIKKLLKCSIVYIQASNIHFYFTFSLIIIIIIFFLEKKPQTFAAYLVIFKKSPSTSGNLWFKPLDPIPFLCGKAGSPLLMPLIKTRGYTF